MRQKLFTSVLTAAAVGIGVSLASQLPGEAQSARYICASRYGQLGTYALTNNRATELVRWQSRYFEGSGYTPERRCAEVSQRFNRWFAGDTARFVTGGYVNGQPVVCAVGGSAPSYCTNSNVLFTVQQNQNPHYVASQLVNASYGGNRPVFQSEDDEVLIDIGDAVENGETTDMSELEIVEVEGGDEE